MMVLSACSTPSLAERINWDVNHDHPYSHYAARDYRELKPGEPGNCAAIAYTKKVEPERKGISATMMTCRLKTGEGHAFLFTREGVLDNRYDTPIRYADVGCE
jgi:predicted transglutaminase-like cysteine proteinase